MFATKLLSTELFLLCFPIVTIYACYHYGPNIQNPCAKKDCPFGAECIPSFDGRSAECVCPTKCSFYGDSRNSRPVCGSDGRDYPNLCELNRNACNSMKDIVVRYNGSCDPCYGVKCPASQICQVDDNRHSICKCNAACGKEFKPVCGSDGKTYINECVLRVEACRTRKSFRILHQGACAENNACKALKCSNYQQCEINRYGIAVCQCPFTCSKVLKPVCGTDGETYDSECELERQACVQNKNISIRYFGMCDPDSFCHKNHGTCKFGSICAMSKNNVYTCVCPQCSQEYSPVCGGNSITYINSCKFRQDMCQKRITNVTFHEGPCVGCENINCQFYSHCEQNAQGGKCVCTTHCDKVHDPVCGSDLVTYPNECELRSNSCRKREYIMTIKRGPCNSCHNVHCDYGARCENGVCVCPKKCPSYLEPVCGSNNITYDNHCKLMASSCESTTPISIQFKSPCEKTASIKYHLSTLCEYNTCKYGGICITDDTHTNHCYCHFNCSTTTDVDTKICGSDGRIYENDCVFQEEMCNRQQEIKKLEMVFCEKFKNIPCQGEPALVNPVTRKHYECYTESCPKDSYCHKGPSFAKCCRELDLDEDCIDTVFGCCPDDKTPALGLNNGGCPSTCQCNRLGSYLSKCDPLTKQCYCKPGVGGLRCDRCEAGYWGLHKISEGNAGCIPCKCNKVGSSRDDCEQMSGRCVCKAGFKGMKCDICSTTSPEELGICSHLNTSTHIPSDHCTDNTQCSFGSVCKQSQCVCDFQCQDNKNPVCASDGNLYESECHLQSFACTISKVLLPMPFDICKTSTLKQSATTSPMRRSTEYQNYNKQPKHVSSDTDILLNTGPTFPTVEQSETQIFDTWLFNGLSLVEMNTLQAYSRGYIRIELNPFSSEGIILYNGQTTTGEGDYIALLIKNSIIELRFNLGSGNVVLKSNKPSTLGQITVIEAYRLLSDGFLSIDNKENITGNSEGPHKLLDLGQNLYIGGTPQTSSSKIAEILGTNKNFTGCIRSLTINDQKIEFYSQDDNQVLNLVNIDSCSTNMCSNLFCLNDASCNEKDKSFRCMCPQGYTGVKCERKSDMTIKDTKYALDFWNQSYIQLPTLQGVNPLFVIEVWLMTRTLNGIIMYNGQSKGDFMKLSLSEGFCIFDFNLGGGMFNKSGTVSIKSKDKISLGEWHRVIISRKFKKGMLQVDDQPIVEDTAEGNLNELNLDQPLFIGGMANQNLEKQSLSFFNGAIQRIVVNGQIWQDLLNKSVSHVNIQQYEGPPCGIENPCLNQGICLPRLNDYICKCTNTYHGKRCEQDLQYDPFVVKTQSKSKIISIQNNLLRFKREQNLIELNLRTKSNNGLILWTSKNENSLKDYLAIVIADGYLELSFDLGKQKEYLSIKSSIKVNDGNLHTILIMRNQRIGILEIDAKVVSSATSDKDAEELNTDGNFWIGNNVNLPLGLPKYYYYPYNGCIDYIKIEGYLIQNLTNQPDSFIC